MTELAQGVLESGEALGQFGLQQISDARTDLIDVVDAECLCHAGLGTEHVHGQRQFRAFDVLEQQRRAARPHHPIDDLGDLEVRIYLGTDPHQIAVLLETFEKGGQIVVGHAIKYRRSPAGPRGAHRCGCGTRGGRRLALKLDR